MRRVLLGILCLISVLMIGCKGFNSSKQFHKKTDFATKLTPLTPIINTGKLPRNYNYGRSKKNSYQIPAQKSALPFDYTSGLNSEYSDLATRYFYYVFDDINKRTDEDHSKAADLIQNTSGEMVLTVNKYKRPRNVLFSAIFTASWATVGPMLVGVPTGHRIAKMDLQIDIKNSKGEVIKTYTQKCRHTAIIGCYFGYNSDNATRAAHLKAFNKGLKKLAKQIEADAPYLNGKLYTPGDLLELPNDAVSLITMGKTIMENGYYSDAIYVLNKSYQINPLAVDEKKIPATFYIAKCLNSLKSYNESAEWMQKAETTSKENISNSSDYKSITESNTSNKSNSTSTLFMSNDSLNTFAQRQAEAKELKIAKAKAYDILKEAEDLYTKKYYSSAILKFEKSLPLIKDNKSLAKSYYHYADCYMELKDQPNYGKAISLYQKSYQLDPTLDIMVPASIFLLCKTEKRYDEASTWYYKTLAHKDCNDKFKNLMNEYHTEMLDLKKKEDRVKIERKQLMEKPVDVVVSNAGNMINGKNDDYFPSITADESMFIFTSRREGSTGSKNSEGKYDEDLWYCDKVNDTTWSTPKNMGKPVNTEQNNGVASFTGDGQFVVTGRCNESDGVGSCDNYYSKLSGKIWSEPKNFGKGINSKDWDGQACISADGKTMVFASTREGGEGATDLWMSKNIGEDLWSTPVNLGSKVNTSGNEYSPYFHPDGKTLFFSSNNISPSMGGHDIYKSELQENGTWSKPENIGYPINTEYDDLYFILTPSGLTGYYATELPSGFGGSDIYRVDYPKAKQTSLVTVVGFVFDEETRLPISADVQIQDIEKNEIVGAYKSNEATGKFVVVLTPGRNYSLSVNKKEYLFYSENFNVSDSNGYKEVKKEVYLQKIKAGKKIVLNNIFFEFGKSDLKSESEIEINRLIQLMNENPDIKVEISGHTDNVGNDKSNIQLSQARAQVVVNALIAKGIAKTRLISKGYGKSMPVAPNDTEEGRQLNRRTEFKIVSK